MCCGSKRLDAARNAALDRTGLGGHTGPATPAGVQAPPPVPRRETGPGSHASAAGAAQAMASGGNAVFVHDGPGELVVTGNKTGRRYRFAGRGARLVIDALDVPALAQVHLLRRLV